MLVLGALCVVITGNLLTSNNLQESIVVHKLSVHYLCSINGVPACANKKLLTDILRKEWGFRGELLPRKIIYNYVYLFMLLTQSLGILLKM